MRRDEPDPLSSGLWLREMSALAHDCAAKPMMEDDHAIRRAYHLACLCPVALRPFIWPGFGESELEALLEKGEMEQAARRVIARNGDVAIEPRTDLTGFVATYNIGEDCIRFEGHSSVHAMIGAWAELFSGKHTP